MLSQVFLSAMLQRIEGSVGSPTMGPKPKSLEYRSLGSETQVVSSWVFQQGLLQSRNLLQGKCPVHIYKNCMGFIS
jgi:hypothetical protein